MACGTKLKKKIREITQKVDDTVREYAGYALSISTNIKALLDSPLGELVTQVIPGDWDNEIRAKASDALSKTIDALAISIDIANEPDLEKKLKLFIESLADKSVAFQQSQLKKIMDLVTAYMDGKRLATHEYEAATMGTFIVQNKTKA